MTQLVWTRHQCFLASSKRNWQAPNFTALASALKEPFPLHRCHCCDDSILVLRDKRKTRNDLVVLTVSRPLRVADQRKGFGAHRAHTRNVVQHPTWQHVPSVYLGVDTHCFGRLLSQTERARKQDWVMLWLAYHTNNRETRMGIPCSASYRFLLAFEFHF